MFFVNKPVPSMVRVRHY